MPANIFDLDKEENSELRNLARSSVCFLPIGIGQKYHTGKEWQETIHRVNRYFKACVIVPVDELHRFTEMMKNKELTEDEARLVAKEDGDRWLEETSAINGKLRIPATISRWQEWVTSSQYSLSKNRIDQMYDDEESDFRTEVDIVINTFITGFINKQVKSRDGGHPIKLNIQRATELCKLYLLEELAFVDMVKNGHICDDLSAFFENKNLMDAGFFMAYPFGHNSTNEDVYTCFENLCSEGRLTFMNLSKPPKKPRQRQKNIMDPNIGSPQDEVFVVLEDMKDQVSHLQDSSASIHYPRKSPKLLRPDSARIEVSSLPLALGSNKSGLFQNSTFCREKTPTPRSSEGQEFETYDQGDLAKPAFSGSV